PATSSVAQKAKVTPQPSGGVELRIVMAHKRPTGVRWWASFLDSEPSSLNSVDRPAVSGFATQKLFDSQQLVIFGDAIGAAGGTGLDLAGAECDGEVGDRGVFRLAAAVAHDGRIAAAIGRLDGVDRLGERSDLVDFDEDAIADAALDAFAEPLDVRHEQVVTDELHVVADGVGQMLPAVPVV